MGPETACTVLYDDPELAHDVIDFFSSRSDMLFPVVERLRPEILAAWEAVRYMAAGVTAHKPAMRDGEVLDVPDWGNAPE